MGFLLRSSRPSARSTWTTARTHMPLHLVEDVHMELFIAMCFVFIGMAFTIHCALKFQLNLRKCYYYRREKMKNNPNGFYDSHDDSMMPEDMPEGVSVYQMNRYRLQRDLFIRTQHTSTPEVGADFDFARYLACSLDIIVEDLTEFSIWTWVFVLVFTAIKMGISAAYRDCSDPTYEQPESSVQPTSSCGQLPRQG